MKSDRLDQLIHGLFDGTMTEAERAELRVVLSSSIEARERYRKAVAIHAALDRIVVCRAESGGPKVVPMPTKRRMPRLWAMVATVALAAGISWWGIAQRTRPVASLVQTVNASWADGSALSVDSLLPVAKPFELLQGVAELSFPSGARVTLEGPCRFELNEREALTVAHGRVSVHAPPGAEGFRVDTPGGKFVDKGTRFGLAVGTDGTNPVVLSEVYEGEVEVRTKHDSARLYEGDSRALVKEPKGMMLVTTLDANPITVPQINTDAIVPKDGADNLALGKPVTSPAYCIRPYGSVFPPGNLTDGRTDDSGVPGDWSFWLAPSGENGEFTVDLLESQAVARISLQNTNNRSIGDRGTKSFQLWVSTDNIQFRHVLDGELSRVNPKEGSYPFQDFRFAPCEARYVKIVVTDHYRHPKRPANDPMQSGGLNEIRVFAE